LAQGEQPELIDALDLAGLLQRAGRELLVKGEVTVFAAASGYYFLNFSEDYSKGLTLFFRAQDNPSEFRPELLQPYVHKHVIVRGKVTIYRDRPQFIMKSLAQIQVQDAGPASNPIDLPKLREHDEGSVIRQ
jgi:exonuclease VII large subunit